MSSMSFFFFGVRPSNKYNLKQVQCSVLHQSQSHQDLSVSSFTGPLQLNPSPITKVSRPWTLMDEEINCHLQCHHHPHKSTTLTPSGEWPPPPLHRHEFWHVTTRGIQHHLHQNLHLEGPHFFVHELSNWNLIASVIPSWHRWGLYFGEKFKYLSDQTESLNRTSTITTFTPFRETLWSLNSQLLSLHMRKKRKMMRWDLACLLTFHVSLLCFRETSWGPLNEW